MRSRLRAAPLALVAAGSLVVAGCADGGGETNGAREARGSESGGANGRQRAAERERAETRARRRAVARQRRSRAPRCAPGAANCAEARGRIVYVESVDPDGDGDLHLVLAGGRVTAPGLSVIDVARPLRPGRDPRPGDWAAAAGPVYTGSYGQRQIQAERLVLDRAR